MYIPEVLKQKLDKMRLESCKRFLSKQGIDFSNMSDDQILSKTYEIARNKNTT